MANFVYATKKDYLLFKNSLFTLLHLVQNDLRNLFTFSYTFLPNSLENLITIDVDANIGFDFEIDLNLNLIDDKFNEEEIKKLFMDSFNKFNHYFNYDACVNRKKSINIKFKDKDNPKLLHSCDFAIAYKGEENEKPLYLYYDKNANRYYWEETDIDYDQLKEKIANLKKDKNDRWKKARKLYLKKKNTDFNKKSYVLLSETVDEMYARIKK